MIIGPVLPDLVFYSTAYSYLPLDLDFDFLGLPDQRIPAIKEEERELYTTLLHLNPLFIQQKPGAD